VFASKKNFYIFEDSPFNDLKRHTSLGMRHTTTNMQSGLICKGASDVPGSLDYDPTMYHI
jgi:hypothetical protein